MVNFTDMLQKLEIKCFLHSMTAKCFKIDHNVFEGKDFNFKISRFIKF